jgi:hypothetical protein
MSRRGELELEELNLMLWLTGQKQSAIWLAGFAMTFLDA